MALNLVTGEDVQRMANHIVATVPSDPNDMEATRSWYYARGIDFDSVMDALEELAKIKGQVIEDVPIDLDRWENLCAGFDLGFFLGVEYARSNNPSDS